MGNKGLPYGVLIMKILAKVGIDTTIGPLIEVNFTKYLPESSNKKGEEDYTSDYDGCRVYEKDEWTN